MGRFRPAILAKENALSLDFCNSLIDRFDSKLKPSRVNKGFDPTLRKANTWLVTKREDKELVEAIRDRERKKLRKKLETPIEEEDRPAPQVKIVETEKVIEKGYSQKDLDDAVQRAVEQSVNRVEVLRKQRKEVKKKAQAKERHDAEVFKEINRALKADPWAECFI